MTARLLRPAEVAEILAVSRARVSQLTATGELRCCRIGERSPRYTEEHITEFLARVETRSRIRPMRRAR